MILPWVRARCHFVEVHFCYSNERTLISYTPNVADIKSEDDQIISDFYDLHISGKFETSLHCFTSLF